MAISEPLAEVLVVGVRVRLHLVNGVYRIRMGSGMGWAPDRWKKREPAQAKLLAMQSYTEEQLALCRQMTREKP